MNDTSTLTAPNPAPPALPASLLDAAATAPSSDLIRQITDALRDRPDVVQAVTVRLNQMPDGGYKQAYDPETGKALFLSNYARSTMSAENVIIGADQNGVQHVLLVHSRHHGKWGLPAGYMDSAPPSDATNPKPSDVSADAAAVRETQEETGLQIANANLQLVGNRTENLPPEGDLGARQQLVNAYLTDLRSERALRKPAPQDVDEIDGARWVPLTAFQADGTFRDADGSRPDLIPTHFAVLNKAVAQMRENDIGRQNANRAALAGMVNIPAPPCEVGLAGAQYQDILLRKLEQMRRPAPQSATFVDRVRNFFIGGGDRANGI